MGPPGARDPRNLKKILDLVSRLSSLRAIITPGGQCLLQMHTQSIPDAVPMQTSKGDGTSLPKKQLLGRNWDTTFELFSIPVDSVIFANPPGQNHCFYTFEDTD